MSCTTCFSINVYINPTCIPIFFLIKSGTSRVRTDSGTKRNLQQKTVSLVFTHSRSLSRQTRFVRNVAPNPSDGFLSCFPKPLVREHQGSIMWRETSPSLAPSTNRPPPMSTHPSIYADSGYARNRRCSSS